MEKKNGGRVAVGFCLDETGSMGVIRDATVAGANAYLDELGKGATVTLTLFSATGGEPTFRQHAANVPAGKVERFHAGTSYRPRGNTPLYDAIGHTIQTLDERDDQDTAVICVIQTDGHENASTDFTAEQIRKLIRKREKAGWRFVYLGADQSEVEAERQSVALGLTARSSFAYAGVKSKAAFRSAAGATLDYAADPTLSSAQIASRAKAEYEKKT